MLRAATAVVLGAVAMLACSAAAAQTGLAADHRPRTAQRRTRAARRRPRFPGRGPFGRGGRAGAPRREPAAHGNRDGNQDRALWRRAVRFRQRGHPARGGAVLTDVAGVLKQHPGTAVTITGYTDAKGSDTYKLALSERRAASVERWLVDRGGAEDVVLSTTGRGEAEPVAPNQNPDGSDNPEGRQKNRRVEISVQK